MASRLRQNLFEHVPYILLRRLVYLYWMQVYCGHS